MRVTDVQVHVKRREPDPNPKRDALQALPGAGSVETVVRTDDGAWGRGEVSFGRIAGAPAALGTLIEEVLAPIVRGSDPAFVRATHVAMRRETEYMGTMGLATFGIASLDIALWDCLGRAYGVPCWKLWGAIHERIPAYAMVGWLSYSNDEVRTVCTQAVGQGYQAVKIKVGYPTLAQDLQRIRVVRETLGDQIRIMVDANQSLTTAEALRRGRAFQEECVYWWEEPLPADDLDGYAELAAGL
jgi:L-alanine-DL-glutamate epimerase-like enolase superfamily enzyme